MGRVDVILPDWPVQHGPLCSLPIAGISHYQQILGRLPDRGGAVLLASYRADFFCPAARLIIEVDGSEHRQAKRMAADAERDRLLSSLGIATMRVHNPEVNADPVRVAKRILGRICRRTRVPAPSNPASPFHGWKPLPPLTPRDRPVPPEN